MTLRGRVPWLVSAGLHLAGLLAVFFLLPQTEAPLPLRMHFVASGSSASAAPARAGLMPSSPRAAAAEAAAPGWRAVVPAEAAPPAAGSAPVSLSELLLPDAPKEAPGPEWSGPGGVGYAPPPLPPPGLSPPQGARWNLRLTVPAGGGPAAVMEGLDSGHPALDQWLEEYLRTVSFPSSPDGSDYQVRWTLRLQSEKPQ